MSTTVTLRPDRQVRFIMDYPDYSDLALAERYGITVAEVQRLARVNRLTKKDETRREALRVAKVLAVEANSPAEPSSITFPGYPTVDYCPSCGLGRFHWSGCPLIGSDHRPPLPT